MSSFAVHPFLTGLALSIGVALALLVATWALSLRVGRVNIVDTVWGLAFVAIAVASFLWSGGHGSDLTRRVLVLALVCGWALRLSGYIGRRSIGKGEDPRYADLVGDGTPRQRALRSLGIVFVAQAAIAWFVSLPVQAAMYERSGTDALTWIGAALWAVGVFFEAVGDYQMASFRKNPDNKGQVMDRGLWRYTRHPNYFGDACLWFGLWVIASQHWIGVLSIASPAAMYYFLSFKSGKPLLEKHMAESKPGYAQYVERTSGFFPLPPGTRLAHSEPPQTQGAGASKDG